MNATCPLFDEFFAPDGFDGREADDWEAHVQTCPDCRRRLEQERRLDSAIADWNDSVPQVDLADRVLARLALDSHSSAEHSPRSGVSRAGGHREAAAAGMSAGVRRQAGAMAAVVIAAAMVLLAAAAFSPSSPAPSQTFPVAIAPVAPPPTDFADPALRSDDADDLNRLLDHARETYRVLYSDALVVLNASPAESRLDRGGEPHRPLVQSLDAAGDGWLAELQDGLHPVSSQISGAFSFLIETFAETQPPL